MSRRRRVVTGVVLGLVALAALAVVFHQPLLRVVGGWLVVQDPLRPADAIVVLAGGTPWREAKAAELFRAGWAPRVVISREFVAPRVQELMALGIRTRDPQEEAQLVLEKHGVPRDRIVAVQGVRRITETELRLVSRTAQAQGYRRVILVSSPEHTRRVRLVWQREAQERIEGIVVPTHGDDPFPAERWWRKRRAAEVVLHEYLGLLAIYLGVSQFMR